jgi:hypothetical protein
MHSHYLLTTFLFYSHHTVLAEGFGLQDARSYIAHYQKQLMTALAEQQASKEHFTESAKALLKESSTKRERLRMYVLVCTRAHLNSVLT